MPHHDLPVCLITVCPVSTTISYTYTKLCFFFIVIVNNIWRRML